MLRCALLALGYYFRCQIIVLEDIDIDYNDDNDLYHHSNMKNIILARGGI
jgi:hypothetical protein